MKYEYYNPVDEKKSCIYRAISKSVNRDYNLVKKEIDTLKDKLNTDDSVLVFETYLKQYNYIIDDTNKDRLITEVMYSGNNIVFGYDKDWYHMICIIDNTLYDKYDLDKLSNLKIIKIYKKVNE